MKLLIFDIDRQGAAVIEVHTETGRCRYRPRVRGTVQETVAGIVDRIAREKPDKVFFEEAGMGAFVAEEVRRDHGFFAVLPDGTVAYPRNAKSSPSLPDFRFFE